MSCAWISLTLICIMYDLTIVKCGVVFLSAKTLPTSDDVCPSARKRITFHGFPQDVRLRAAWLRALGKRDSHLPDYAVVCSQHFLDDDIYETENGLRQICTDAIPSTVQVCTICLDTDSKLFLMSKHKFEDAYEKLIGHPVCDQGNLKQSFCIQCARKLISFSRSRDKSLIARALMMDLVEKHELITRNHIKTISRTKHQLKSNFEVKMLGPDHCDLYILEDASEDKQTESCPSLFTTSLCSEATVQGVVVKNEEKFDSLTDQDMEMPHEDTNNADSGSDEFVASNEDLISDNSIMLETRLMDEALRKVLESNRAVAEQVAETMAPLKCESVPSECTLCSEEFVGEHACMQHMHMRGQSGDGDVDSGTSRVCKPHTAVSSSHSSRLTENKSESIEQEQNAAKEFVSSLVGDDREVIEVNQGDETDEFWEVIGGPPEDKEAPSGWKVNANRRVTTPLSLTAVAVRASGKIRFEELPPGFTQKDLSDDGVYILDGGEELYVWLGKNISDRIKEARLQIIGEYIEDDGLERTVDSAIVVTLKQGREPAIFKQLFPGWDDDMWDVENVIGEQDSKPYNYIRKFVERHWRDHGRDSAANSSRHQ